MDGTLTLAIGFLILKATLVVAGAAGLSLLLRRSSAASRHALWTGTLVVLLILPALPLVQSGLPTISIPFPQGVVLDRSGEAAPGGPDAPVDGAFADAAVLDHLARGSASGATFGPAAGGDSGDDAIGPAVEADRSEPGHRLAWLWLLGTLLCLAPLGVSLARGRHMIRRAVPLRTPEWLQVVRHAALRVGLSRPVPTRIASEARSAMAGGVLRPVVLLPRESEGWNAERRHLVLLHELVHVKRRDPARQILGRVVTALFWFHPLVWWAVSNAAMAREEACDERVVQIGGRRPSTYAEHLLELHRTQPIAAGLTGFHHPDLEKRLMAILDPAPRTRRTTGLIAGTFAILWTVSVMLLAPPADARATQVVAPPDPPPTVVLPRPAPEPAPPTALPGPPPLQCEAIDGDSPRRVIQGSVDGVSVCLSAAGTIEWSPDGTRILSMEPGARMVLTADGPDGLQRLEIEGAANGTVQRWSVDGEEAPVTPAVEEWRDALLTWAAEHSRSVNLRNREARLIGEMARIQGEGARAQAQIARVQAEELQARARAIAQVAPAPELRNELARASEELVELQTQIARAVGEQARVQGEQARLQVELTQAARELERTQDEARREELTNQIRLLEERLASVPEPSEAEVAELRYALAERRSELEQEARRIQREVETRVQERSSEIQELRQEEVARVEEVRAEVARTMAENEERIRSVQEEIEALQPDEELERLEARLLELEARLLRAVRAVGGGGE